MIHPTLSPLTKRTLLPTLTGTQEGVPRNLPLLDNHLVLPWLETTGAMKSLAAMVPDHLFVNQVVFQAVAQSACWEANM